MQTNETHREYLQRCAAETPWYPYRPVAVIGGLIALYWLLLFVFFGVTWGLLVALGMGYITMRAWTWEWYAHAVWKLYARHDA